ncbi:alpha/beta fold hydrolase [Nocardia yunnanensis]|uniref:Alpha/beta fold hydrolase n=1 Tax=Nocardia yunnanensis TaxID=2382165 RepID=A0A386Z9U9_9NOCA|nr:alpha/beta hydrolase [Nocardia yunnanensis]AYF74368.1 alpha/beta fold hydrolase [Nocardia yunnanensis]
MRGELLNDGLSMVSAGRGPDLVVLPGLGEGADLSVRVPRGVAWATQALAAGLKRQVHQINRPMNPPAGMTIPDLAAWHATALTAKFGAPVDIMGVSAGGTVALQLALDHPQVVRRLVLCITAARLGDDGRRELTRMVESEPPEPSAARNGGAPLARGPVRLLLAGGFRLVRGRPRQPGEAATAAAVQDWDVRERLGEITAPTLVAGGMRDRIVAPELVRATASGIAGARLLLMPGRGHTTALYDPRLKAAIAAFLAQPV